uniref:Uncharacterized protein n=1 Tax=Strigamia maritima TaxID=126957 RepID=T1J1C1_STRMM
MSGELDANGMVQSRVLRSPSHESVTTDLSLLSLSSCGSDMSRASTLRNVLRVHSQDEETRGSSPFSLRSSRNSLLQVPGADLFGGRRFLPEVLFEEESEVIRSCGALSTALGLRKSFSSSDIVQTSNEADCDIRVRTATSESAVANGGTKCNDMSILRLEYASRSCSTWVAVGDMSSTSQLPSPNGPPPGGVTPTITAVDLVRSVNKKVRQSYIQRRLLATYQALERLAQSELSLDKISELGSVGKVSKAQLSSELLRMLRRDGGDISIPVNTNLMLTVRDVEREKGKPLTKYERNMMIFNWLHSLEDSTFDMLA